VSTEQVDVAVTYLPMQTVGGDYAKFHFGDDRSLLFMICDVTGHGVPAALLVNRLHSEIERMVRAVRNPGRLLNGLNEFIIQSFPDTGLFLSAFCGRLDFRKNLFEYSNHGHPPQYLYRCSNHAVQKLNPQATLLGIGEVSAGVYVQAMPFAKGDRILLFTDGVIETKNEAGKDFGEQRVIRFLEGQYDVPPERFNQNLLQELADHGGPEHKAFQDDIFLLTIHVK
jgi:sigma-B regulation protein RsbU (phosphoserine phosphatase)